MRKRRQRRRMNNSTATSLKDEFNQSLIWTLRTLLYTDAKEDFLYDRGYQRSDLIKATGIHRIIDNEDESVRKAGGLLKVIENDEINQSVLIEYLEKLLLTLSNSKKQRVAPFWTNLKRLVKILDLNSTEMEILAFAIQCNSYKPLADATDFFGSDLAGREFMSHLASILDLERNSIQAAFHKESNLVKAGLLRLNMDLHYLRVKFIILDGLGDILSSDQNNIDALIGCFLRQSSETGLTLRDYPHLREDTNLLVPYLLQALNRKTEGVNILLYGPPGTGKTELAKVIAKQLRMKLYKVSDEDETGEPVNGFSRLMAFQLNQRLLEKTHRGLILFDEIEDVFPETPRFFGVPMFHQDKQKSWMNRLLENNPIPTLWLSNTINQIDPAILRRYDLALEVPTPPKSVRRLILTKHLKGLNVSKDWIEQISDNEQLAPGYIQKAAKIATHLERDDSVQTETILENVIRNNFHAAGTKLKKAQGSNGVSVYNLEYTNTSHELAELINGLHKSSKASICMYGPPGSGKTAFARYLVEQLDKELLAKRASDILSMWVGGTEANIAGMFRQAEQEDAVLLLDEADSFFQERQGAQRSWEITQVNEMLVQMENFDNLFICTTNLMDSLDSASLRRFDLKIHFDYLKHVQAWQMFLQVSKELGIKSRQMSGMKVIEQRLNRLRNLTPGDFATVKRQSAVLGKIPSPAELITALEKESQIKPGANKQSLGFMSYN
jgi:transitional endoplasmic reticulum ATPase